MDFARIFDGLEEQSKQSIRRNAEDYEKDGILMCGICNTPKQYVFTDFLGKVRKPYVLCKCAEERKNAEEKEERERQRQERINERRRIGFPDAEMRDWRFEKDDGANPKLSQIAHRYVENFETMLERRKGLLLFGGVGTGKSFIAACIANALIERGYPCMVTNFARIANRISASFEGRQEIIDELDDFDLLVLDDVAAERDTEYMGEIVQSVIDARYRSGKPLIVTTNLTADELKNPADIRKERIYSRLFEMCIPFEVKGADRRTKKMKTDFNEFAEILGI